MGDIREPLRFLKLYVGTGIGSAIQFTRVTAHGVTASDSEMNLAWHIMGGAEIELRIFSFIFEYQMIKVKLDDRWSSWQNYLMFGIRI